MAGRRKFDRTGSGPLWYVMLAAALYALYSLAVAAGGVDDCGGGPKSWQFFPPAWECDRSPGFG